DLDLIDSGKLVFHRVFQGNDTVRHDVLLVECRIKTGRFTATSGPGNEDHAVRLFNDLQEGIFVFTFQTQIPDTGKDGTLVEKAHDDPFPQIGGQGCDTDVEFLIAHLHADMTILGMAGVGNIQFGNNLDSGN